MGGKNERLSARDRRRQILLAATELFSQQGYNGTTTQQIARRVGVNEALLFRHFPRKEDLYWAVIEAKCRQFRGREELIERVENLKDDGDLFAAIARDMLRRNSDDPTLSRLLLFTALEHHRLSSRFFRTYVAHFCETLARHIRKRIRQGVFRPANPLLAARGFVGMIIYHFLIQELFGGSRVLKLGIDKAAQSFTDIWLQGVEARREPPVKASQENSRHEKRPRSS